MRNNYVIIGAGVAGLNAAATLRTEKYEGNIILIDRDSDLPYNRPPLSKEYLSGQLDEDKILLRPANFFKDNNIELKLGNSVIALDTENQKLELENGEFIKWDKLLITIGSELRKLNVPGKELQNIHYLKTKENAKALKENLKSIDEIVIIGAGFIGSEVAATCRKYGINVTMIEALSVPLERVLGENMGKYMADLHLSNGVNVITNEYVVEFKGTEKIEEVVTNTGRIISCQAAVIGIGVELNLSLVNKTEIKFGNGIEVDKYCETNIPGIFAAGDCALWPYQEKGTRIEHWSHALNQGVVTAKNMIKPKTKIFDAIPYFWSDQYDVKIQYLGYAKEWDQTVLRGNMLENRFTIFYMKNNKIIAGLFMNDPKSLIPTRRYIKKMTEFTEPKDLSDETLSFEEIRTVTL